MHQTDIIFTPLPSWSFFYIVTPWEQKHFSRYPWTFLPGPKKIYTSTASAASDKYHVCFLKAAAFLENSLIFPKGLDIFWGFL